MVKVPRGKPYKWDKRAKIFIFDIFPLYYMMHVRMFIRHSPLTEYSENIQPVLPVLLPLPPPW